MKIRKLMLLVLALLCLSSGLAWAAGTDLETTLDSGTAMNASSQAFTERLEEAPLNPDFLEYLEKKSRNVVLVRAETEQEETSGLIPTSVDFSGLKGAVFSGEPGLPAAYDLRAENRVTPAKSQGSAGACWAFASISSLESGLLPTESRDFSENNMKNLMSRQAPEGYDVAHYEGGNDLMAIAYLARWTGPVNESDDPYSPISGYSPPGLPVQKHVQEMLYMPARAGSLDNENIKQAILDHGAVYATIYSPALKDSTYYDSANHSSYYYTRYTTPDHAINIVGWNDSYPKESFSIQPPGDGAFIVKNSWGSTWGENGYCYVSYYDSVLGKINENTVFLAEDTQNYDFIYQYDPLGWVSTLGYEKETGWGANVFTAASPETLTAVSFYTVNANTAYEIRIYTDPSKGPLNPTGPSLSQTGTCPIAGYHTVALEHGIKLSPEQRFSVVMKLTTPGERSPLAVEKQLSYITSKAEANPGESYVSSNGEEWSDLTGVPENSESNLCIKAFTIGQNKLLPETNFSANVTSGVRPLTVEFTDMSVRAKSWAWDVDGDGMVDYNTQNPTHTYLYPGLYNVSLTAVNENGSDLETKFGYVNVSGSLKIVQTIPEEAPRTLESSPAEFGIETNELCTITWNLDGKAVLTDTNSTTSTYSNSAALPGTYSVSAEAKNSYESVRYTWFWTVFDWNPWDEPESGNQESVITSEVQEAIHCWLNNESAPQTGAEVTDERLEEILQAWLES